MPRVKINEIRISPHGLTELQIPAGDSIMYSMVDSDGAPCIATVGEGKGARVPVRVHGILAGDPMPDGREGFRPMSPQVVEVEGEGGKVKKTVHFMYSIGNPASPIITPGMPSRRFS